MQRAARGAILLLALPLLAAGSRAATTRESRLRSAPDVSAEVQREAEQNLQIHDGFVSQERADEVAEAQLRGRHDMSALSFGKWVVALDKDMKTSMLVQVSANASSPGITDPCGSITCAANLQCPGTFNAESLPGHCCPYCVNPDITLESVITGATGSSGGKASVFCPNVWCFPTMCTKATVEPTTTSGACCTTCPP